MNREKIIIVCTTLLIVTLFYFKDKHQHHRKIRSVLSVKKPVFKRLNIDTFTSTTKKEQKTLVDFQNIYEKHKLHQKQRFMGVRFGQDPFDALVIAEILFDVKPDLIIETGSNSGGSALYFASLMSNINPDCKIVTIEAKGIDYWHKKWNQEVDPRETTLWADHVVAYTGYSTDETIINSIRDNYVAHASRVVVLLDSDHHKETVSKEIEIYSKFVTRHSYLVVQDTWISGAGQAAKDFERDTESGFIVDKQRHHLLFTQHKNGYFLKVT